MDRNAILGYTNPLSPPLVLSADGKTAVGRVTFGGAYEGSPGVVHGGFVAAVFDQLFGYLGVLCGMPALTGSLTVRYRKPTPIAVELQLSATVERAEKRKWLGRGRCVANGELVADAEALFVIVEPGWLESLMQPER
jgi:acyl-coenzyme A thioesterase PaaI-like protein